MIAALVSAAALSMAYLFALMRRRPRTATEALLELQSVRMDVRVGTSGEPRELRGYLLAELDSLGLGSAAEEVGLNRLMTTESTWRIQSQGTVEERAEMALLRVHKMSIGMPVMAFEAAPPSCSSCQTPKRKPARLSTLHKLQCGAALSAWVAGCCRWTD